MIQRLKEKHVLDIYEFVKRNRDVYQDFYVTIDKQRKFLNDLNTVDKIVKYQDIYGLYTDKLQGILIIYREKGFRPYIKLLSSDRNTETKLIRFLLWNFSQIDLYIKLKKNNPLVRYLQAVNKFTKKLVFGFIFVGNRGEEILLLRKGIRKLHKEYLGEKDDEYRE